MARVIDNKDLKRLIDGSSEKNSELNAALVSAAALWGLKASELSLVEVGDILTPRGELKRKWVLRKEISFNNFARELYTEHESLIMYLNTYLDYRAENSIGITNIGEFRGLNPSSKVFLDDRGNAFNFSRRSANDDGKTNLQPTGMNNHFKRLFVNSSMTDVTFRDFRNSLAINIHREGSGNVRIKKFIMELLGIRSYDALTKILNSDPRNISDMVKGIYKRI